MAVVDLGKLLEGHLDLGLPVALVGRDEQRIVRVAELLPLARSLDEPIE